MTLRNNLAAPLIHRAPLGRRMAQGAAIALVLISIFLLGVHNPNPAWPRLWMVKPLLIVPCAGAMGGVFYYFMDHLRFQGGWKNVLATLLSVLGYIIALWLGTVLGLNGTLWN